MAGRPFDLDGPAETEHGAADGDPPADLSPGTPSRYARLSPVGRGGMGEVWRVHDPLFDRVLVQKALREDRVSASAERRLLEEARRTARLEHPAIAPVYDLGTLPDGRPYFTMREVRGVTLERAIHEHHAGPAAPPARLVDALIRVVEAVAYAHQRGVIHQDIKPSNIMVGELGEVVLLDWGAALGEALGVGTGAGVAQGRDGAPVGTPAYMAPEQARGDLSTGFAADIYALGAVLYHVLAGRPPFTGGAAEVLDALRAGPPPALRPSTLAPLDLVEICDRAMARAPEARWPDATALLDALHGWRDGARRAARARERVQEAQRRHRGLARGRADAAALEAEVNVQRDAVKPWDPVRVKGALWALEDRAAQARQQAEVEELQVVQLLGAALQDAPELEEAHSALAAIYREQCEDAELRRDTLAAARAEALLRQHDRGEHRAWLEGMATLQLRVDPPDATVSIYRVVERQRRRVPELEAVRGPAASHALRLGFGSWLLVLEAPGRATARLPVWLDRGEVYDLAPPHAEAGWTIHLPLDHEVGPDDVFIPAGRCQIGGTSGRNALPRQRVWVDGFALRRFPVTNQDYISYLNALVDEGRLDEALARQPLREGDDAARDQLAVYGRDEAGRFVLKPDREGDLWDPLWPVVCVSWEAATAYAAWEARRTGLPWRLPGVLEREKAGRGADGRSYPWGDHREPTWCANAVARPGRALPARIDEFPEDESIYGVRGLAGNVRDWCLEARAPGQPQLDRGQYRPTCEPGDADTWRWARGGAWSAAIGYGDQGAQIAAPQRFRNFLFGFRLARSWPG